MLTSTPRNQRCVLDPEDLTGLRRAHEGIRDSIPLISEHLSGLSGQMKPLFTLAQGIFRTLAFSDISHHTNHPQHPALRVEGSPSPILQPNCTTIGTQHSIAGLIFGFFRSNGGLRSGISGAIVLMNSGVKLPTRIALWIARPVENVAGLFGSYDHIGFAVPIECIHPTCLRRQA